MVRFPTPDFSASSSRDQSRPALAALHSLGDSTFFAYIALMMLTCNVAPFMYISSQDGKSTREISKMAYQAQSLSSMFKNPALRAAFERAERDNGNAYAIPAPKLPKLSGGAAVKVLEDA
ncbi:hypothetical protein [Roseibium algicola]|uniref:hypothetical protein n=1 Tax=Roseibium algicola TaxID=2857014 RepID=UPI0014306AA7|nr:hypothetical protein [Roseibium aggregatum]